MPKRIHIMSFVGLTIVAWLVALWAQGIPVLTTDFLKPFSIVVGVIGAVATIFNKWAWSWAVFRGWYINRPDIRGTWKVILHSDWTDPKTSKGVPPICAYMAVKQSLTTLSLRLMTPESHSRLIAHSIDIENDEIFRLAAVYRNEPKLSLQGDRSEIHHGSMVLEIYGTPPISMEGNYWTDRATRGTMKLIEQKNEVFDTFEDANSAFTTISS